MRVTSTAPRHSVEDEQRPAGLIVWIAGVFGLLALAVSLLVLVPPAANAAPSTQPCDKASAVALTRSAVLAARCAAPTDPTKYTITSDPLRNDTPENVDSDGDGVGDTSLKSLDCNTGDTVDVASARIVSSTGGTTATFTGSGDDPNRLRIYVTGPADGSVTVAVTCNIAA